MEKSKKIKIFIALFYVSAVSLFLFFFFSKFTFQELTSYDFIKNNRDYFFELRQSNLFFIGFLFFIFCVVWVLASGFATPIALFGGFVFGKWLGTFIVVVGMSIGATGVYLFANYFLYYDLLKHNKMFYDFLMSKVLLKRPKLGYLDHLILQLKRFLF